MTLDKKLNDAFEKMMKYRQSIGYATATYRSSVPPFINFCVKNHPLSARITQEMVDEWLAYYPYTVNSKAAFISLLREYTKYLNFLGYDDYIPDDNYVVKRIAFNPYLFTDDELFRLFKTIDSYIGKTCGKRYQPEVVLPVYSRLLYCCGLHPQEPPAIRTEDVDLVTGDVYIRQSKRHKDRHIIMSDDMRALCQKYDYVAGKRQWFFQKWDGTPYETSWYNQVWRNLISKSSISWKGTPRPYDLRHAFASRNIIRWINSGKDVMELLPYLSAYMGHSELTSTLYYIHLLPESLRKSKAVDWDLLSQVYGKGGCRKMRIKAKDPRLVSLMGEFMRIYLPCVRNRNGDTIASYRYSINLFVTYLESEQKVTVLTMQSSDFGQKNIAEFLYESGARINEVLSLKLLDVKATSNGEADVHFYGKGKKHRITPLSREIWNQFEDYCEKYHPDKTSEDLLFYSFRNGRRNKMSSDNVSRILAGCEEEVRKSNPDLVHLHSHLFRRTRAMHLYQAGVPLPTISEWLGHSNIETTRFYAKVTEEMKREALHKLGDSDSSIFKDDVVFKYANDEDTIKRLCGLK